MRWYLTYKLSSRDLREMMAERSVDLAHATILRWVQRYVPEFEKRCVRTRGREVGVTDPDRREAVRRKRAEGEAAVENLDRNIKSVIDRGCLAPDM